VDTPTETLPPAVSTYLNSLNQLGEAEVLTDCFLENAVVRDEAREYVGLPGIKSWKLEGDAGPSRQVAVIGSELVGNMVRLRTNVNASADSSSMDYVFELSNGKISILDIKPAPSNDPGGKSEPEPNCGGAPSDG